MGYDTSYDGVTIRQNSIFGNEQSCSNSYYTINRVNNHFHGYYTILIYLCSQGQAIRRLIICTRTHIQHFLMFFFLGGGMYKTHYVVSKTNTRKHILCQQWKIDAYEPPTNTILLTYTVTITSGAFISDHQLTSELGGGGGYSYFREKTPCCKEIQS